MHHYPRTIAAIAAASLLAVFAAQANKGADYKAQQKKNQQQKKEQHKNFFLTGGATYLEPSFNGLDYAQTYDSAMSVPAIGSEVTQPAFNWGYYLAAGYRISQHYDVQASWAQYNSSIADNSVFTNPLDVFSSNQEYLGSIPVGVDLIADSRQNIDYSVFDAHLGQYHNITDMLKARLFAGVRWAKIDTDTNNLYTTSTGTLDAVDEYHSSFNGAGPEVGLDLEYKIWRKFGVVGHLAAAFLIGEQESESYVVSADPVTIDTDNVIRMIPAIDAKLGVNWNVPYKSEKCSFGIEAGYQVAYYWDVVDQVQFPNNTDSLQHNYANYGNMGPYLNLTAMF